MYSTLNRCGARPITRCRQRSRPRWARSAWVIRKKHSSRRERQARHGGDVEKYIAVTLGPSFKLGHALEASLFIHTRRLEVITRHPNAANTSVACLRDEGIE